MKHTLILIVLSLFALIGCDRPPTSDEVQQVKQEQITMQAVQSVGMPAITHFAEMRMAKDIIELRDQNVATITYLVGMNNQLQKLCNSVGFGLPYATQFTNPQRMAYNSHGAMATLPQADPNGLFSPSSADATWVFCVNPETKKAAPMYVEPKIIVSQWELK
jgi:hypothetical protein